MKKNNFYMANNSHPPILVNRALGPFNLQFALLLIYITREQKDRTDYPFSFDCTIVCRHPNG